MLPSPRTIKYFEALAREGDAFNYEAWLTRVRQEEAEEKAVRIRALAVRGRRRGGRPSRCTERRQCRNHIRRVVARHGQP
jgi:hypothetical protein